MYFLKSSGLKIVEVVVVAARFSRKKQGFYVIFFRVGFFDVFKHFLINFPEKLV